MPTIAVVDGVKIQMFFDDHIPPHFHATIGGQEVLIAITTLEVIRGALPPANQRRVLDWAGRHRAELALNWIKCQSGQLPEKI